MKLNGIDISKIVVSRDEDGLMLWFVASEPRVVANLVGSLEEMQRYIGAALMMLEDVEKRGLPTVEIPVPPSVQYKTYIVDVEIPVTCPQCKANIGAVVPDEGHVLDGSFAVPSSVGASAPEIENYNLAQEQGCGKDEVC